MAIWQYVAYLVPAASLRSDGTLAGVVVGNEEFELPPLSFSFSPADFERLANEYLARAKSWGPEVCIWGDGTSDDVAMITDEGRVSNVRIRLDLRDLTIERLRKLLWLAQTLRCCFLNARNGEVVAATEEALLASIRTSRSADFVLDPRGFFDRLAQQLADRPSQ